MCFAEMFALIAKQSPASFPEFPFFIRLSISFACLIAFLFRLRKMLRFFVFGVAIFFENCIRFWVAVSFPFFIRSIFCFRVIFSTLLFRLRLSYLRRMVRSSGLYLGIRNLFPSRRLRLVFLSCFRSVFLGLLFLRVLRLIRLGVFLSLFGFVVFLFLRLCDM